jgi:hypothetical protein
MFTFDSTSLRVPDHVSYVRVGFTIVLLDLAKESYFGIDEVGSLIWESVINFGSVEPAVRQILSKYDVDDSKVRIDVDKFLDKLCQQGLLMKK